MRFLAGFGGVAVALWLAAGCSSTSNQAAPGDDAGDDGSAGGDDAGDSGKKPPQKESCDPYQPRATDPDLFIGPSGLEAKLVGLIKGATTSIDLMIYEIDTSGIISALVDAQKRDVKVRVIADRNENAPAKSQLKAGGVDVTDSPAEFSYYHVKSMVIDGNTAVVMSANMNSYSVQEERNYGVVLTDDDDIADLEAIFNRDHAGSGDVNLDCTRLIVAPINARSGLLDLISRAKTSLDLSVMYMTDRNVIDAVKAKAAAGVAVRVLLGDPAWVSSNTSTAQELAGVKIPVEYYKAADLHAKLVLVDDAAFVGSENMSANSLDHNREIGVFVTNKTPLDGIRAQFAKDWGAGVAAP